VVLAFLARQQEGCLADVLGILVMAKHAQSTPRTMGPVPRHQRCERILIAFFGKNA